MANFNPMELTPQKHYFEKLRPMFESILLKCKYDPNLVKAIESTMNQCDLLGSVKDSITVDVYNQVNGSLENLLNVTASKSYQQSKLFLTNATQEERNMIFDMNQVISDTILVLKYTDPVVKEKPKKRQRIGYDERTHENAIEEYNKNINPRKRIPN